MASVSTVASRAIPNITWKKYCQLQEEAEQQIDSIADPQRDREYKWEWSFRCSWGQEFKTIARVRRIVKDACALYGVEAPVVVEQTKSRNFSVYRPIDHRILLVKGHWCMWGILHEVAHAICVAKWDIVGHGPRFLGVLMWLLAKFGVAPVAALTASAKAAGLKFVKPGRVAPRRPRASTSKRGAKRRK